MFLILLDDEHWVSYESKRPAPVLCLPSPVTEIPLRREQLPYQNHNRHSWVRLRGFNIPEGGPRLSIGRFSDSGGLGAFQGLAGHTVVTSPTRTSETGCHDPGCDGLDPDPGQAFDNVTCITTSPLAAERAQIS